MYDWGKVARGEVHRYGIVDCGGKPRAGEAMLRDTWRWQEQNPQGYA